MTVPDFLPQSLKRELGRQLPGSAAHMNLAPEHRRPGIRMNLRDATAVPSSVLVLLYPSSGSWQLALIRRPRYDGPHSGQISFPGGKREESDLSFEATALRETQEEVGVDPRMVKIIGRLTELYIPPSNYIIYPVVGWAEERPEFKTDPEEVAALIEVRLADLLEPSHLVMKEVYTSGSLRIKAPCYYIGVNIIWGATAMILSELVEILRRTDQVLT